MPKKKISSMVKKTSVDNSKHAVNNGLSEAIMGFTPGGMGTQLNQIDTIFQNNRWYMLSNMRQVLSQLFVEHGLVQTLVNVPVDDAFRGGYDLSSRQLSADQIE
ncbi:MAG: DUF1073 domain-containing protein, partial [Chlorobiales bacterium]|nr:DUF1073 domain-containing protein [Chlorobiales bacterium]